MPHLGCDAIMGAYRLFHPINSTSDGKVFLGSLVAGYPHWVDGSNIFKHDQIVKSIFSPDYTKIGCTCLCRSEEAVSKAAGCDRRIQC